MSTPYMDPYGVASHASSTSSLSSLGQAASPPPPYSTQRTGTVHLTPYHQHEPRRLLQEGIAPQSGPYDGPWISQDPRSSSTQSLAPPQPARSTGRRTLLLVYIHGFMGNETSFQSFPAHVHNLVKITLADTHVVHTKIYPRYKSRKAIDFARDDFSKWLSPHESPDTDVVLLGHSMGGILGAEVVLLPPLSFPTEHMFRHRILGTINFDTPFLGMHPGVVVSGIGSLFRPAPQPPSPQPRPQEEALRSRYSSESRREQDNRSVAMSNDSTLDGLNVRSLIIASEQPDHGLDLVPTLSSASGMSLQEPESSPFASPSPSDPNYNPAFPNDIRLPIRKGWDSTLHFINKHSDGLAKATKQYLMSHLEFGGCLADYPGLRTRYSKIRALEDINAFQQGWQAPAQTTPPRVRFVNYYTTSTGRSDGRPKPSRPGSEASQCTLGAPALDETISATRTRSVSPAPRISVEEERDGKIVTRNIHKPDSIDEDIVPVELSNDSLEQIPTKADSMLRMDPGTEDVKSKPLPEIDPTDSLPLPAIPPPPIEPPFLDISQYKTKEERKAAEKAQAALLKAYKQAVKDRNRAIKNRPKVVAQYLKQTRKKQEQSQGKVDDVSIHSGLNASVPEDTTIGDSKLSTKQGRERRFCVLPSKVNGRVDLTWVPVKMVGVDEVGAHCGLFFMSETYSMLVGDVAGRIEDWVKEVHVVETRQR